jgi:hypothetical protein
MGAVRVAAVKDERGQTLMAIFASVTTGNSVTDGGGKQGALRGENGGRCGFQHGRTGNRPPPGKRSGQWSGRQAYVSR